MIYFFLETKNLLRVYGICNSGRPQALKGWMIIDTRKAAKKSHRNRYFAIDLYHLHFCRMCSFGTVD